MTGDRAATRFLYRVIATPYFVLAWFAFCLVWWESGGFGFDPAPYFILNILMSTWATFTLPVIAMSDRWISEQQDKQIEQIYTLQQQKLRMEEQQAYTLQILVELAEGQRDMTNAILDLLRNVDSDVDRLIGLGDR